ncbi:MAG TPA: TonB-dependent receptor [Thermoanaerobaculaceae bacterium]|nr:TonB-dependent receptor [Thermoanaerobaculaceae bacterium]
MLLIVVLLAVAGATAQVAAAEPISFDVKPQAMGPALRAFAEQANLQVYYPEDLVVGLKTAGVKGRLEIEPALQELLKGSGLGFQRPDAKTIVIVKLTGQTSEGPASHVAEAIIVTAGKREQEVREVAGSVTPVTSEVLETKGAESFADYLAAQPGVSFNASTPGISQINIRGVSTTAFIDQGQQTTGFYINEIPLTEPYFSVGLPDLDAFDVERVEVLRGPQGSLFGSATLGGAVHFITKPANPNATEARVELGSSSTTHADGLNYGAKAMVNVPLVANQLALRLVATTRDEPGYLDNVGVGVNGSTDLKVSGGRMTLDWRPTDRLHFVAFGMYSSTDNKDTPARYPALGEWQRDTKVLEPFKLETSVYSLRGEYFWDAASLTVNVAHTDKQQHLVSDVTPYFGSLFGSLVPYVYGPQDAFAKGDTVEARLTSVSSGRLEWLVGVSYTHTKEDFPSYFTGPGVTQAIETIFSPIFGAGIGERTAPDDIFFRAALPIDGKEKAVFGEATYRLSDRWRITFGGRYFDTDILTTNIQSGLLQFLSSGQVSLETSLPQHETKFTPKVSLSYEPNKDTLLYALVSQGFRFGGVNLAPPSSKYPTPETFGSDILTNYEVGVRLAWMDRRLTLDVTPYYLDWHDIQLRQARPDGFAYAINAGKAANKGVEVALHSLPSPRLALDAAVSYLDATLRQDVVDNWNGQTVVKAGTQLPMAAKWNAMASASWNLGGTLKSLVTASYRYVGSAPIDLAQTFRVGNYSLFDLRARISALGVDWEAFAENIADKRAVTTANTYAPYAETYVRPRTVGLRMIYDLK